MSRQNPFMRSTGDRSCNNCQSVSQNNCSHSRFCCDYSVAGRATGTSQIVGMAVVTTTAVNSILTVRNPAGNAAALTISPLAGGTRPVSSHLVITQIS